MGEFEAAGEIITGGLLGRAMEPRAGEGHGHDGMCLNCGTALIGPHCHHCGQAGHVHRSLHAMGHEILHGVFHFEGKLWRTLPMLAWRPGDLTRRYIHGERARFVSPMAIFLFSIFAMFAVFSFAGISTPSDLSPASQLESAYKKAREETLDQRKKLVADRAKLPVGNSAIPGIDERLKRVDAELQALDRSQAELNANGLAKPGFSKNDTGWPALDHGIEKWKKNPSLMLYKLQSASYKFSWLLIPLSLPFVWLLFAWKREYKLYDHTVFITYSIAFMSLLFIAVTVAAALGVPSAWLATAAFVLPFVHLTRQLKQAYALRWWSAVLRAFVLSIFIWIVLMLFLAILLALGMFG